MTPFHFHTSSLTLSSHLADENLLKIKLYGSSNGDLNGNVSEGNLYPPEIEAELEPCLLKPDKTKCYRIGFFPEDAPQGYPRGSLPFVHQNPGQIDPNVIFSRDVMHQKRKPKTNQ